MNWWLMLLSFVLGFALSWLWMVRRVTREVPRERTVSRDNGAGVATGAAAAGAVGLAGAGAATLGRDAEASAVFDQEAPTPSWGREAATIGATAAADKSVDVPQAAPIDPDVMHPVELEGESDDLPEVAMVSAEPVAVETVEVESVEPVSVESEAVQSEQVETESGPAGWQYAEGGLGVSAATIGALAARDKTVDEPAVLPTTDPSAMGSDPSQDPTAYDAEDSDYVLTEAATDEVTVDDAESESEDIGTVGALAGGAVAGGAVAARATDDGPAYDVGDSDYVLTEAAADEVTVDDAELDDAELDDAEFEESETVALETEASEAAQSEAGGISPVATDGEYAAAPVAAQSPYGPGSAAAAADGSGPEGWLVKGNAESMLFHTQDSPGYGRTRAEVWFQDEASAASAGFQHWDRKRRGGLVGSRAANDGTSPLGPTAAEVTGGTSRDVADTATEGVATDGAATEGMATEGLDTQDLGVSDEAADQPAEVERLATEEPAPVAPDAPYGPGSASPTVDGAGPVGWEVKGNANSMLFHTQESPSYAKTRPEVWFQDEASAKAAGFAHWDRKRR